MLIRRNFNNLIEQIKEAARSGNIGIYDEVEKSSKVIEFKAHFGDNGRGKFSDYFKTLREFFLKLEAIPGVEFVFPLEYNPDPLDDVYDFTIKIQLGEEKMFSEKSTFLIRF